MTASFGDRAATHIRIVRRRSTPRWRGTGGLDWFSDRVPGGGDQPVDAPVLPRITEVGWVAPARHPIERMSQRGRADDAARRMRAACWAVNRALDWSRSFARS